MLVIKEWLRIYTNKKIKDQGKQGKKWKHFFINN